MRSSTDFYFLILWSFKLVIEVSLQVTDDRTPVNRQLLADHFFSFLLPIAVHHNFPFWRKNQRSFKRRPYTAAKSFLTTQCLRESSLCLLWVVKVSDACSKVRWIRAIPSSSLKNVSDNISGTGSSVIFWISIWTRSNLIPLSLHISKYMLFSIITQLSACEAEVFRVAWN